MWTSRTKTVIFQLIHKVSRHNYDTPTNRSFPGLVAYMGFHSTFK